jgi:5'-deoxynucleotidase YfbR-like HD superfamily hydrolase
VNKIYQQAMNLSNVFRFARLRLANHYSVSEHSYRVAILAMLIADDYNANADHGGDYVNVGEVLRKALLHDMEEATIGDIPAPVKRNYPDFNKSYNFAAHSIMSDVCAETDTDYFPFWQHAKDGISGRIVGIADKLESLYATASELERSNYREIQEAHEEIIEYFNTADGKSDITTFPIVGNLLRDGRFY